MTFVCHFTDNMTYWQTRYDIIVFELWITDALSNMTIIVPIRYDVSYSTNHNYITFYYP